VYTCCCLFSFILTFNFQKSLCRFVWLSIHLYSLAFWSLSSQVQKCFMHCIVFTIYLGNCCTSTPFWLVAALSSVGVFYALPCLYCISGKSSTSTPFGLLLSHVYDHFIYWFVFIIYLRNHQLSLFSDGCLFKCTSILCPASAFTLSIWELSAVTMFYTIVFYPTYITEFMFVFLIWSSFPKIGIISTDRSPTVLQFLLHMTKWIPRKLIAPHKRPFNVSSSVE